MASSDDYDKAASDIRRPGTEQADGVLDTRELIRHALFLWSNPQRWQVTAMESDAEPVIPANALKRAAEFER